MLPQQHQNLQKKFICNISEPQLPPRPLTGFILRSKTTPNLVTGATRRGGKKSKLHLGVISEGVKKKKKYAETDTPHFSSALSSYLPNLTLFQVSAPGWSWAELGRAFQASGTLCCQHSLLSPLQVLEAFPIPLFHPVDNQKKTCNPIFRSILGGIFPRI